MDPLTDLGVAVAGEVASSSLAKIKKHVAYVYNYKENIDSLKEARAHLDAKRADASKFSDDAETRLREVGSGVKDWQSDANRLYQKAEEIISTSNISCLNLWSRHSLGKHALELTQDIADKVRSAPDFGTSFDRQLSEGDKFNLKGFMEFESRRTILDRVLEVLRDEDVSMCSICGMGGVGKTTMAKKLVQLVEAERLFDKVAMVTVSQYPKFEKIQNEIIELLGLKFDESSEAGRAKKLKYWLSNNKSLLILDDVWWHLHDEDFENIGIPLATKECKIVVTSRNEDECRKMGSQSNFRLNVLEDREARDLFIQNAEKRFEDRGLQETARKIIEECDGLPIAIVTIARALKDKPAGVWEDSLRKLKKSNLEGISGMEKVHSRIQLSYDLLNDREAQQLFRLCCLFPEDSSFHVQVLFIYGWGLELFKGVESLKEARDRVDLIVDKLKKSFLLLDGETDGSVRLHDIVRDFAVSISSKNEYPYLVRCEEELEEWPETCQYEKCSAISIVCEELKNFPVGLKFPNLKLLQIFCEKDLGWLLDGLCEGMEELKVLLLQVKMKSTSLTLQKKLRVLVIDYDCENDTREVPCDYFGNILHDGDMKNLELFCLTSLRFNDFPKEIGLLSNLRCLMFNSSVSFGYMPPNVLSNLVKLEELELPLDFNRWGLDDEGGNRVNASLDELESLPLNLLTIRILEGSVLAEKLVTRITRFQIFVGNGTFDSEKNGFGLDTNIFRVSGADEFDVNVTWISILMRKCDKLILSKVKELKPNNGFPCTYFSQLKVLKINDVDGLEEIVHGPYLSNEHPHCYDKLTEIEIEGCPKLKRVFPLSVAQQLTQLQSMKINSCQQMKEIFYNNQVNDTNQIMGKGDGGEVKHVIVWPRLKLMLLNGLDELKTIFNGNHAIECPSLEELEIKHCKNMEDLSYGSLNAPKTKRIELIGMHWKNSMWLNPEPNSGTSQDSELKISECHEMKHLVDAIAGPNQSKNFFSSLKSLSIEETNGLTELWHGPCSPNMRAPCFSNLTRIFLTRCLKLRHVFPLSVARELTQLEELKIKSCPEIEEIFHNDKVEDGYQAESSVQASAPTIEVVPLQHPNYDKSPLLCPTPQSLLRGLLRKPNQQKSIHTHQITEERNEEVDERYADRVTVLPQLKRVILHVIPNLKVLFNGNPTFEFPSLEELEIHMCGKVEGVCYGSFNAPKTRSIRLGGVRNLINLIEWLHWEQENEIPILSDLRIGQCNEMIHLFDEMSHQYPMKTTFSRLQILVLEKMNGLEKIWHGPYMSNIQPPRFVNLTDISITQCPKLKGVFPLSVATELAQLNVLNICDCEEMEMIFYKDEVDHRNQTMEANSPKLNEEVDHAIKDAIVFPQLKVVILTGLPKLRIFYDGNYATEIPLLNQLKIDGSKEVEVLFNGRVKSQNSFLLIKGGAWYHYWWSGNL